MLSRRFGNPLSPLLSPFPEMTLRFPPFFNVFGKGCMRSGRGGRKFESCRLDEDEIPGNVEKSRLPGVFLCENAPLSFRRGALTDWTVLLLSGGDPQAAFAKC